MKKRCHYKEPCCDCFVESQKQQNAIYDLGLDFLDHCVIEFACFGRQKTDTPLTSLQPNHHFMKKLPKDAEASNILVGELSGLTKPLTVFIRLNNALFLGDLTEVPVPTRFIFVLLTPKVSNFTLTDLAKLLEFDFQRL